MAGVACITWQSIMPRTPVCKRALRVHGKAVWLTFKKKILRLPHLGHRCLQHQLHGQGDRLIATMLFLLHSNLTYRLLPPIRPALCLLNVKPLWLGPSTDPSDVVAKEGCLDRFRPCQCLYIYIYIYIYLL